MQTVIVMLHQLAARRFRRADVHRADEGATAVEYGLMVALIAIVIIGVVTTVGENLREVFNNIALHTALGGGGGD